MEVFKKSLDSLEGEVERVCLCVFTSLKENLGIVENKALDADFQTLVNSYSLDVLAARVQNIDQDIIKFKNYPPEMPISVIDIKQASGLSGTGVTPRSKIPLAKSRLITSHLAGTWSGGSY